MNRVSLNKYAIALLVLSLSGCSQSEQTGKVKAELNYALPLYTVQNAIVCPSSILFEKRVGKDIAAANDALVTTFGRSEAIKNAGCQEWKAGIRVYIPGNALQDLGKHGWKIVFESPKFFGEAVLIYDLYLTNENPFQAVVKPVPTPGDAPTPNPEVAQLLKEWYAAAVHCQTLDLNNEEATKIACEQRNTLIPKKLNLIGWCYNDSPSIKDWEKCH